MLFKQLKVNRPHRKLNLVLLDPISTKYKRHDFTSAKQRSSLDVQLE